MSIIDLIRTDGYLILNRCLIKALKLHPAIVLCELINQCAYYRELDETISINNEDDYFFEKISDMEERIGLSRKEQDSSIKKLKELGLIKMVIKGVPGKRYFKINEEEVAKLFSNSKSRMSKRDKVECAKKTKCNVQKGQTDLYIEENKKETKLREKALKRSERENSLIKFGQFVTLTQEEYDSFCKKHTKPLIDELIDTLNDYCASVGTAYKDYAATMRNWIRREPLKARSTAKTPEEIIQEFRTKYSLPNGIKTEIRNGKVRISKELGAEQWVIEVLFTDKNFAQALESAIYKAGGVKRG